VATQIGQRGFQQQDDERRPNLTFVARFGQCRRFKRQGQFIGLTVAETAIGGNEMVAILRRKVASDR